jgi:hypothetical protein
MRILLSAIGLCILTAVLRAPAQESSGTGGFLTRDRHFIIGECRRADQDPSRCALKIMFELEIDNKLYKFCRHIQGVTPYDRNSLTPFGPLFRPRLIVTDGGELSGAIAEYNVVTNGWMLYEVNQKKWVEPAQFGTEIEKNLSERVTNCL